jgi:hypothetical protein
MKFNTISQNSFVVLLSAYMFWSCAGNYCHVVAVIVIVVTVAVAVLIIIIIVIGVTPWRNGLRHYATSRKVVGSIPDKVFGFFN